MMIMQSRGAQYLQVTVQVLEDLFELIRSNDVIVRNATKDKWTGGSEVDCVSM